jgi:lysozyme
MAEARHCHTGPTVEGVDVASHQGYIDWDEVKAAGIVFAFIRTGDGMGTDSMFERNWREAGRVGIKRAATHFVRVQHSGVAQARHAAAIIKRAGGFGLFDLAPVANIEWGAEDSYNFSAPPEEIVGVTGAFLEEMESIFGRKPIIYTGGYWRDRVARPRPELASALSRYPLWRGHWTPNCPAVTSGWDKITFWQYSNQGSVPGIRPRVDLDVYFGSSASLSRFALWNQRWLRGLVYFSVGAALAYGGYRVLRSPVGRRVRRRLKR